jgi:hypothetical protein
MQEVAPDCRFRFPIFKRALQPERERVLRFRAGDAFGDDLDLVALKQQQDRAPRTNATRDTLQDLFKLLAFGHRFDRRS